MGAEVRCTRIRREKDVVADEENNVPLRLLDAAIARCSLLALSDTEVPNTQRFSIIHYPLSILYSRKQRSCLRVGAIAHDDHFDPVRDRLPREVSEALPQTLRTLVCGDDDGK